MAGRVWTAYRTALTRQPYLTSAITSALVLASGDVLAQSLEHRQYLQSHPAATASDTPALRFQGNRTLILSVWGGAFFSPFFTRVFHWLETIPALKQPTPRNLVLRALTIFAVSQPLNIFFFIYTNTAEHFLPVDRLGEKHIQAAVVALPLSPAPTPDNRQSVAAPAASTAPSSSALTAYEAIRSRATAQIIEKAPTVIRNALLVWGTFNYFVRQTQRQCVTSTEAAASLAPLSDCCCAARACFSVSCRIRAMCHCSIEW
jgi:hypothetical protein